MRKSTRKSTRNKPKMNSVHYVTNEVILNAQNTYQVILGDFSYDRCINSDAFLRHLVSVWNYDKPVIEYYSGLSLHADRKKQCAEVVRCHLDGRVIRGEIIISGPYSRHLRDVLLTTQSIDIAVKGTYDPFGSLEDRTRFLYTSITGLRYVFPNARSW